MAQPAIACLLYVLAMSKISVSKSEKIFHSNVHQLPYWIQDSLLEYADEIGDRNITGPIRQIYRKDLNPSYVAYYEFQFNDEFLIFSAGPKTGDHRLVEEGQVPRITDILIAQAGKVNKVCQKFFRLHADGITICEDNTGKAVASTIDLRTGTSHVNATTLSNDMNDSQMNFAYEWEKLATKIRSSLEWKEISIYSPNKNPSDNQRTVYKVLTPGDSQAVPVGTSDLSKVEMKTYLQKSSSHSKKMLSTLCLILGNICSEDGKVNVSGILFKKKNLDNLNYIEIDVTEDYDSLMKQLGNKNIDLYLQLTVAEKFVVIRRYTISLSRKRNKRSAWGAFATYSIPYENLMPDYDQHMCCGGCWSGCVPVAWAQLFAYYDRVAHTYGYRYSTNHWRGTYGISGSSSEKAPGVLNWKVEKYVEALRSPLRTFCDDGNGATYTRNTNKVDGWFRQRQRTGRVITLSMSNIKQQASQYVKQGYPVLNSFWWYGGGNKKSKSGHAVVVTKIKERSRQYKTCRKVGFWWGRRTKCDWKTAYEYEWYRRMGWGGSSNGWYPASATGAYVAVV